MHSRHRFYVFCGSLAALAAPLVAVAADNTAPAPAANEKPAISYRAEEPAEQFTSNPNNVLLETRADGTRLYHMNGEGMQSITAQINADGKLRLECTDAADNTIQAAAPMENAHEK
ncbi:MAG TPA: hypothetical protein VHW73_11875 [Rudaea sp.]|jgi:hypothetical protein|nr:hypothetical protein [Rudaea sp.]